MILWQRKIAPVVRHPEIFTKNEKNLIKIHSTFKMLKYEFSFILKTFSGKFVVKSMFIGIFYNIQPFMTCSSALKSTLLFSAALFGSMTEKTKDLLKHTQLHINTLCQQKWRNLTVSSKIMCLKPGAKRYIEHTRNIFFPPHIFVK